MFQPESLSNDCLHLRQQSPLILNITNYVAMSFSANALLAAGASPLMSSEPEEMTELVKASDALVINIGCLEQRQAEAMAIAARAALEQGKPWVLDPAGVGLSRLRRETVARLISEFHPCVIRGNASEILVLAGEKAASRGVDSAEGSEAAVGAASRLASETGAVISLSGEIDFITDGRTVIKLYGGSPMMPRVTAMGCAASALTAAFLAVDEDRLAAAASAMALMGAAGEKAASESNGPGSFAVNFIDALASLNPEAAAKSLRYEQESA